MIPKKKYKYCSNDNEHYEMLTNTAKWGKEKISLLPLRKAGIEFEEMASLHALIAAAVIFWLFCENFHDSKKNETIRNQKEKTKDPKRQ